jgi:transketolase N-terminal domain/subunit
VSNSHQGDSGICGVFLPYPAWVNYLFNKYRNTRPHVNGVSLANRDKTVFCLGSDGSQQEGNDAEAARLAVAQGLNVKLLIDDNDATLAGHPSEYLKGCDVSKTLEGHGLKVVTVQGEDLDSLWGGVCAIVSHQGPAAGVYFP